MAQKAGSFVGLDFANERELYEAILTLSNWTSAFFLFDFTVLHARSEDYFKTVTTLCENTGIKLDPIEAPLLRSLDLLRRDRLNKGEVSKRRNKLESLRRVIDAKSSWYDRSAKRRVLEQVAKLSQATEDRETF